MKFRIEKDVLGSAKVPEDAYYGLETQRALENFNASGIKTNKTMIYAYAILKYAAAHANISIGKLNPKIGKAIMKASKEVASGKFSDQFNIDVFQAGAGTNLNMNLNEVIANRAIELLNGNKGDYNLVNPNDHVNMSQSTNDTYHTAVHIASYISVRNELLPALKDLNRTLDKKAQEFEDIIKVGRTHLQNAVPISMGQEFKGYSGAVAKAAENIRHATDLLLEIPLGGTAVGTGINASKGYAETAALEINKELKTRFFITSNKFKMMPNQQDEVFLSDSLKECAITINKIANDLRLLSSSLGGRTGELSLPELLPGSSIMPGKINPSAAEMMNMVCFQIFGYSYSIDKAADSGQLQLNVYMPLIAHDLLLSIDLFSNGVNIFTKKCIDGIKANRSIIKKNLDNDISIVTALTRHIGYAKAAEIARMAYKSDKTVKEVCLEMGVLDKKTLDRLLDPKNEI